MIENKEFIPAIRKAINKHMQLLEKAILDQSNTELEMTELESIELQVKLLVINSLGGSKQIKNYLESNNVSPLLFSFDGMLEDIIQIVDSIEKDSKFEINVASVLIKYKGYASSFFRRELIHDLKGDNYLQNQMNELNRKTREKRGGLYPEDSDFSILFRHQMKLFELESKAIGYVYKSKDGYSITRRSAMFPHKVYYSQLYLYLVDCNKGKIINKLDESDFKEVFYPLLEKLLLDDSVLNDKPSVKLQYGTEREYKLRRINKLLLG